MSDFNATDSDRELSMDDLDLVLGGAAGNVSATGSGDDEKNDGGAHGAGGQGGDHHGSDPSNDGAGGAGGYSHPDMDPYPSPPAPTTPQEALFQNWVSRTISAGESFLRDGSQLLSIPIITDVVFPPKPQA